MTTTHLPQPAGRYGLPEAAIGAIQQVLAAHPQVEQAILYGSRAMGSQRYASDSATRPCWIPSSGWGRFFIATP
jgi:hypothetical protein